MTKFFDEQSSRCTVLDLKATFMVEKCCGWEECHAAGVPALPFKKTDDDHLPGKEERPEILNFETLGSEYFRYADAPMILSDEITYPVKTNIRKWKQTSWTNTTSNEAEAGIKDIFRIHFGTEESLGNTATETEEYEFLPPESAPYSWAAWTPYYACFDGSLFGSYILAKRLRVRTANLSILQEL